MPPEDTSPEKHFPVAVQRVMRAMQIKQRPFCTLVGVSESMLSKLLTSGTYGPDTAGKIINGVGSATDRATLIYSYLTDCATDARFTYDPDTTVDTGAIRFRQHDAELLQSIADRLPYDHNLRQMLLYITKAKLADVISYQQEEAAAETAKVAEQPTGYHPRNGSYYVVTDESGHFLSDWCDEMEELCGYTRAELDGHTAREMLHYEGTDRTIRKQIRDIIAERQPFRAHLLNQGKCGRHYTVRITARPRDDQYITNGYEAILSEGDNRDGQFVEKLTDKAVTATFEVPGPDLIDVELGMGGEEPTTPNPNPTDKETQTKKQPTI